MAYTKEEDERIDLLIAKLNAIREGLIMRACTCGSKKEAKRLQRTRLGIDHALEQINLIFELGFVEKDEIIQKSEATGIEWKYVYGTNRRGERKFLDVLPAKDLKICEVPCCDLRLDESVTFMQQIRKDA